MANVCYGENKIIIEGLIIYNDIDEVPVLIKLDNEEESVMIAASQRSKEAKLIYSDWLEERGRPAEAEKLREIANGCMSKLYRVRLQGYNPHGEGIPEGILYYNEMLYCGYSREEAARICFANAHRDETWEDGNQIDIYSESKIDFGKIEWQGEGFSDEERKKLYRVRLQRYDLHGRGRPYYEVLYCGYSREEAARIYFANSHRDDTLEGGNQIDIISESKIIGGGKTKWQGEDCSDEEVA